MSFIIVVTLPSGQLEYIPEGFGYSCHSHVKDITKAEKFDEKKDAQVWLNAIRYPRAFWPSEIKHRSYLDEKYKGWKFSVEEIS